MLLATEHLFGIGTKPCEGHNAEEQPVLFAQDEGKLEFGVSIVASADEAYPGLYQLD